MEDETELNVKNLNRLYPLALQHMVLLGKLGLNLIFNSDFPQTSFSYIGDVLCLVVEGITGGLEFLSKRVS